MARTATRRKKTATPRKTGTALVAVPEKFKVVDGGKRAAPKARGPKPGRETAKKTRARKRQGPMRWTPSSPDVPIVVDESRFPKGFEDEVLALAQSRDGVTRVFLTHRGGKQFGDVGWRPWMKKLAEKHGLEYSVSNGRPVFYFKKPAAMRKRA
jgi:hypothetical protein